MIAPEQLLGRGIIIGLVAGYVLGWHWGKRKSVGILRDLMNVHELAMRQDRQLRALLNAIQYCPRCGKNEEQQDADSKRLGERGADPAAGA